MKFLNKSVLFSFVACLSLIVSSCQDDDVTTSIKTYGVCDVTATSAVVRVTASITGDDILESGLLYSKTLTVLKITNSSKITSDQGSGTQSDFMVRMTDLSTGSYYRYRPYIKTSDSIYYGSTVIFRPLSCPISTQSVTGGTFLMGNTDEDTLIAEEMPVHSVTLSDYEMGTYEVTNAQFLLFLRSRNITSSGASGMTASGTSKTLLASNLTGLKYRLDSLAWVIEPGAENNPVAFVTWYGAREFCRWAGGHLPTEAEWEYAARGGASSQGYKYSGSNTVDDVAWYYSNRGSNKDSRPVGQKAANELGLYDMTGNVWEFVADWYYPYLPKAQTNPTGMSDDDADECGIVQKVCRGGGWADTNMGYLRVSKRLHYSISLTSGSTGFRFAKGSDDFSF
jgi:formylglycine-generating enzyme required for sulfatase activity